jgi:hypothetical protein
VAEKISSAATTDKSGFTMTPVQPVVIQSVRQTK